MQKFYLRVNYLSKLSFPRDTGQTEFYELSNKISDIAMAMGYCYNNDNKNDINNK